MLPQRPTRLRQPILWIAVVVLVLGSLGNHLRFTTCIGDCCAVVATAGCDADTSHGESACCCCSKHEASKCDDLPTGEQPPSDWRGTCDPDCCVTVAFDIEMAPIATLVDMPEMPALTFAPVEPSLQPMLTRTVEQKRPFDRDPPRVDRRTALRACTVLLI